MIKYVVAMALAAMMILGFDYDSRKCDAAAPPIPGTRSTMNVSDKNHGNKVPLLIGDTLVVSLPVNMSTGYSWKVQYNRNWVLEPIGEPQVVNKKDDNGKEDKTGKEQIQVFRFKVKETGKFTLSFAHRKGDEWNNKDKRFKVTVVVKE